MTDLKAANEALAKALQALESPEHDADVREAEACRNRLIELDGRIGARIQAKLEAHKAIALGWQEELLAPGQLNQGAKARVGLNHGAPAIDESATVRVIEDATISRAGKNILAGTRWTDQEVKSIADAWQAHHEEHTGKYAMAGDEIPERVLSNGVAEMQQGDVSRETVDEA